MPATNGWPASCRVCGTRSSLWLTLRASAIGLGIGVIPGMGGAVSQFIAYAHAQHTSKHPETFGKGNVEGAAPVP